MDFQRAIFLKKWNKSLGNSKSLIIERCCESQCKTKTIIAFKHLLTVPYSRYMQRIGQWCHDNYIEYDFIDILPHEGDEDQETYQGIHIQFNY
jgi:hypothetical protein